jgi:hypothetical protein
MTKRYAQFDRAEYACLKKDLSGPLARWEFLKIQEQIQACEAELADLASGLPRAEALKESLDAAVLGIIRAIPKGADRQSLLRGLVDEYRRSHESHALPHQAADRRRSLVDQIRDLYFGFDQGGFTKDFEEAFIDELTDDSHKKRAAEIRERIAQLKEARAKTDWMKKPNPERFLSNIPPLWRGCIVFSATKIIDDFLSDWRSRTVGYEVPVTITGIEIASLPPKTREIWQRAYDALELRKILRNPIYIAIKAEREPEAEEIDETIPEAFRPIAKGV